MSHKLPILIAGGGIGGLSCALGLARKGFLITVLEKASQFGEIGAGIQLGPNAFHAFDYFGIGDKMRDMAVFIDALLLMDAMSGQEITQIPLGDAFRKRFNNPYAVIHRGDLHKVFLNACEANENITLLTKAEVKNYTQTGETVTVQLADERKIDGAALIGADGLWSNIRQQVAGEQPPRVSGHTTYRSVIPTENMPQELRWNAATLWAGPKCHIVHYPLQGWKTFNLVVTYHNHAPAPVAGAPCSAEEVLQGFTHICARARDIISYGKDWKYWVLCDRDPITTWQDARVVLLGDAAHPTLQYMAQGACMAMEDAVCLAETLAREPDFSQAFATYTTQRTARTARIQIQSRLVGDHIYHPAEGHAALRNAIMQKMQPEEYYERLSWLYGHTGLDGENRFA